MERRKRIQRPKELIIISILLILSPVYNYILQLKMLGYGFNLIGFQNLKFNLIEYLFLFIPVVCGIGLYYIQKWAWYLFLIYSSILISFNLYSVILRPIKYNFYSLFESSIVLIGVIYFLRKDISAPYFKMFPRGFRGEKRKPIQIDLKVNNEIKKTRDFTNSGFYVHWVKVNFQLNQEVEVELEDKIKLKAGVVRIDYENDETFGVGFAFRSLKENDILVLNSFIK